MLSNTLYNTNILRITYNEDMIVGGNLMDSSNGNEWGIFELQILLPSCYN